MKTWTIKITEWNPKTKEFDHIASLNKLTHEEATKMAFRFTAPGSPFSCAYWNADEPDIEVWGAE